jgi:DDE superfamily endonuclease.
MITCICTDGIILSPGLIYKVAGEDMPDNWLRDFNPDEHNCFFASSPSGWTNDNLGYLRLTTLFNRKTKAKVGRSYRLLIFDGHGSHITIKFIDYAIAVESFWHDIHLIQHILCSRLILVCSAICPGV